MIELLRLFPLISLILTHPLENISLVNYQAPERPIYFLDGTGYIAPHDGIVREIAVNNGLFQMTISLDDGNEVVYSGLTSITKDVGERVLENELIGVDNTISSDTKFILLFYEESNLFPQFDNINLTFFTEQGTRLFMVADGTVFAAAYLGHDFLAEGLYTQVDGNNVTRQSFIPLGAGSVSQIKLAGSETFINYMHLMGWAAETGQFLQQGERVAYSGVTGSAMVPKMVLNINDAELGEDMRVIYFRR